MSNPNGRSQQQGVATLLLGHPEPDFEEPVPGDELRRSQRRPRLSAIEFLQSVLWESHLETNGMWHQLSPTFPFVPLLVPPISHESVNEGLGYRQIDAVEGKTPDIGDVFDGVF